MNKDIELYGCFAVTFFLLFWHLIVIHLANPLKKSLQCAWRVKNLVRLKSYSLILRHLKFAILVVWNLKYSFQRAAMQQYFLKDTPT